MALDGSCRYSSIKVPMSIVIKLYNVLSNPIQPPCQIDIFRIFVSAISKPQKYTFSVSSLYDLFPVYMEETTDRTYQRVLMRGLDYYA